MWNFLALLFVIFFDSACSSLSCLDHYGNPVDWFLGYKLPLLEDQRPLLHTGAAYLYMTPADIGWQLSHISINSSQSILGITLENLYVNSDNLHIVYNDQNPNGTVSFTKGHTKGVVLADERGGLWLIHSIPHFPSLSAKKYYYPDTGYKYGQSFMCISFNRTNLDKIGSQLKYNEPYIYSSYMPAKLMNIYTTLKDVVDGNTVTAAPWNHVQILDSVAGVKFTSFAKSHHFGKDLYLDWVAPTLNATLLVETWPHEPRRLPSDCNRRNKIYNVVSLSIPSISVSFNRGSDHSKWAVASKNDQPLSEWICIGDINRAVPQEHRGGGTTCFNNRIIASAYQDIIKSIEKCN